MLDLLAVLAVPLHGQLAGAGHHEVGRLILVAEGVAADDDRVGPARDQPRHVLDHDRLAEDDAAEDVADRAVGRLPHLLEAELLDPRLVGRDRRAFDADAVLLDRLGGLDRDPVVGLVALLDAEIEIEQVDVEIGEDQPLADPLPDDPGHLVAVELDDGFFTLILAMRLALSLLVGLSWRGGVEAGGREDQPEPRRRVLAAAIVSARRSA